MARSWQEHPGSTKQFADKLLDHVDLLKAGSNDERIFSSWALARSAGTKARFIGE
jgi:hypothetical protein